jgi:predicted membrane-bound spermidine synthase
MDSEIIAAFVGPLFTTVLAGVGIAIKSFQVRRRELSSRARDIQVAAQTVTFIDAYLSAHEKLDPESPQSRQFIRERALRDLETAYQTMMITASADHDASSTSAWLQVIKRALLIGVRRTAAKVVRVCYVIALLYGFGSSTLYVSFALTDQELLRDIPVMIATLFVLLVFAFLPAVLFYLWARWLDRDRSAAAVRGPAPPNPWPQPGGYGTWQPVPGPPSPPGPPEPR